MTIEQEIKALGEAAYSHYTPQGSGEREEQRDTLPFSLPPELQALGLGSMTKEDIDRLRRDIAL